MAINNIQTALRNTLCDAFVDSIDDGPGQGILTLHTAAFAALLATLLFTDPAFGVAAAGVRCEPAAIPRRPIRAEQV